MQTKLYLALAAACALGITSCTKADAQRDSASGEVGPSAKSGPDSGPPRIESNALSALNRMGAYLQTLKSFEVKGRVTRQGVLSDGQTVSQSGDIVAHIQRPNRMHVELSGDRKQREYFYDGSNFTVFAPRQNVYATTSAPATLGELASTLESKYAIQLPLFDLFRWGSADSPTSSLTGAIDVGPAACDGGQCEQYAFRQEGKDWQVWIQQGEQPLPRKVVITTTSSPSRPQSSATYDWNLSPSFKESMFVFSPPSDAKKISLTEARSMRASEQTPGGSKQ